MMINVKNNYFTLTVKKDILDIMNDTTTYLNVENNQHVIVEPCKTSKLIVSCLQSLF